jgi:hypothetical protein
LKLNVRPAPDCAILVLRLHLRGRRWGAEKLVEEMCPSNEEEQRNLWMRFRMLTALSTHGFTYSWPPNTHACVLDHLKLRTLKNSFLSEKRNRYCKDKIPPRRTHLSVDFFPFSPLLCLFFPFPTSHLISYISFELFFDGVSVSHSSPQLT